MSRDPVASLAQNETASPDYVGLVKFLVQPFLESSEFLSVDCEPVNNNQRVWLRLAFDAKDKGRVFGRGGRNIQAIRKILNTAAVAADQSVYLDIYEPPNHNRSGEDPNTNGKPAKPKRRSSPG